jgi:hypothetical protein
MRSVKKAPPKQSTTYAERILMRRIQYAYESFVDARTTLEEEEVVEEALPEELKEQWDAIQEELQTLVPPHADDEEDLPPTDLQVLMDAFSHIERIFRKDTTKVCRMFDDFCEDWGLQIDIEEKDDETDDEATASTATRKK